MWTRCTNSKEPSWKDYGGRGITICSAWSSFDQFFADMGPREKGLSLDRIDVNGNYEKSNCRYVDAQTQAENKRIYKANKTGVSGVVLRGNRYYASTSFKGKSVFAGCFPITKDGLKAAAEAIKKAKQLAKALS